MKKRFKNEKVRRVISTHSHKDLVWNIRTWIYGTAFKTKPNKK